MIGLLHGYMLEGSGSNLWTREVVRALCRRGETVHLVCQERHPEHYDFIDTALRHHPDGRIEETLRRATRYAGRCILHEPVLGDTLPVYVWDRYEAFTRVVPMVQLDTREIESYLARNVAVVEQVTRDFGLSVLHANHAVLMSVVAERVSARTGVPFVVMPHGSALEYAVRPDPRFHALATGAFTAARRVIVTGSEIRERTARILSEVPALDTKFRELPLGVNTAEFEPIPREHRREKIGRLLHALAGVERAPAGAHDLKLPDADLEDKLSGIDWEHDAVLLYVGRLISAKGVQAVIAALPQLLAREPDLRLVVVGHGPLRPAMEALVRALGEGDRETVERIVMTGRALEGDVDGGAGGDPSLGKVRCFLDELAAAGRLEEWYELAQAHLSSDRVVFTGYLTHHELRHLFPCCDAGVFPSVVKESGPLVFLEALASGCFPIGTYFGGMRASIDALATALPAHVLDAMKVDPRDTVPGIVRCATDALRWGVRYKDVLARAAIGQWDWTSVAARLASELRDVVVEADGKGAREPRPSTDAALTPAATSRAEAASGRD